MQYLFFFRQILCCNQRLPVRYAQKPDPVQYIRYTPNQKGSEHNSCAQQRIIHMAKVQQNPMDPQKFKITQKIPHLLYLLQSLSCICHLAKRQFPSNWKNLKEFTTVLDKRLAAYGRGLQRIHNEKFANSKAKQERTLLKKEDEVDSVSQEARERDRLYEHRRERNIAHNKPEKLHKFKQNRGREISERIAL
ncbi:unnamed protein product [Onchocerca flexuosa]|uniref:SKI-interacting protein SKIP SNW domain-containing protein n=1 Tax=Onchocerca flexuosa TaxID=387005 RepID=A0A3P8ABM0_9BILA|nr:unnamed protein product [Onchocerca flexuosa]